MVKQQQAEPPVASTPAQGALTVEMAGTRGSVTQPDVIEVRGLGIAPTRASTLRDVTGLHTGRAIPLSTPCKPDSRPVAFATGSTPWCVQLSGIAAGHELSGSVKNADGNTLTLTVRRRDAFWWGPAMVLVAGLLVGLLAIAIPARLRRRVRELVLERLLAANDRAAGRAHIDGLRDWVHKRRADGQDIETIIAAVDRVLTYGPDLAKLARAHLSAALVAAQSAVELPPPLEARATALATHESPSIGEFYADDGSKLKVHSADTLATAVTRAAEIGGELAAAQSSIAELPENLAKAAREAFATAQARYVALATPEQVGQMDDCLQTLEDEIARARSAAPGPVGLVRTSRGVSAARPATRGPIETVSEPAGGVATLGGRTYAALFATALVALLAISYASVSIWSAAYDSKPLFHGFGDYLTLFSAALGSSAAGSVLALVGYWQVTDSPSSS